MTTADQLRRHALDAPSHMRSTLVTAAALLDEKDRRLCDLTVQLEAAATWRDKYAKMLEDDRRTTDRRLDKKDEQLAVRETTGWVLNGWVMVGSETAAELYPTKEALIVATKREFFDNGDTSTHPDHEHQWRATLALLEEEGVIRYEDGYVQWIKVSGEVVLSERARPHVERTGLRVKAKADAVVLHLVQLTSEATSTSEARGTDAPKVCPK